MRTIFQYMYNDIHGNNSWKNEFNKEKFVKVR